MATAKHIVDGDLPALESAGFWDRVQRIEDGSCWPWTGPTNQGGYGRFIVGNSEHRAHRVAFALGRRTPLPGVVMVCHRCDNPACCNPDHLFIGLATDNNADARDKGRHVAPTALRNGKGKLSDEQVRDVLTSRESGAAIARRFGVSQSLVSMIRRGQRREMVGDAGIEPATFRV